MTIIITYNNPTHIKNRIAKSFCSSSIPQGFVIRSHMSATALCLLYLVADRNTHSGCALSNARCRLSRSVASSFVPDLSLSLGSFLI